MAQKGEQGLWGQVCDLGTSHYLSEPQFLQKEYAGKFILASQVSPSCVGRSRPTVGPSPPVVTDVGKPLLHL